MTKTRLVAFAAVLVVGALVGRFAFADPGDDTPAVRAAEQRPQGEAGSFGSRSPQLLYVHDAAAGTFAPVDGKPGTYRLARTGADNSALYFSDRPDRVVGSETLEHVLAGFFKKAGQTRPNAAVSAVDPATGEEILMGVELVDYTYDADAKTLEYTVRTLEQEADATVPHPGVDAVLPATLGETSVFIDDANGQMCAGAIFDETIAQQTWTVIPEQDDGSGTVLNNDHNSWGVDLTLYPYFSVAQGMFTEGAAYPTDIKSPGNDQYGSHIPAHAYWGANGGALRGCSVDAWWMSADKQHVVKTYLSDPFSGGNTATCDVYDVTDTKVAGITVPSGLVPSTSLSCELQEDQAAIDWSQDPNTSNWGGTLLEGAYLYAQWILKNN